MAARAEEIDTGAVLIERAQALVPTLAARAEETARLRRMPDETFRDLRDLDLLKAARAERFGGYALGLDEVLEIVVRLGRGCGSSAWVYGIYCDHAITVGMFEPEAQDEVWGASPEAVISSGLAPSGKVERLSDGFRLTGRWQFSSGCDHADWVFVQSMIPPAGDGEGPTPAYFLLPRSDWEIDDTWFVTGLAGTGSKDVVIGDAFVPRHRMQPIAPLNTGEAPGARANPAPIFRLPRISTVPFSLVAPALGVLDAMIDAFVERTGARATRGVRHAELTTVQLRLAEAAAERDCARLLLSRATQETMAAMRSVGKLSLEQRARNRRDMAYIAVLLTRAADRIYTVTGASGLFDGNAMKRMFHDIRAVGAHHITAWDIAGPTFGQVALGVEPTNPLV